MSIRKALVAVTLVAATACSKAPESSATPDAGTPDFNYIPDYSTACMPSSAEMADAAVTKVGALAASDTFRVAGQFEVCSDHMKSSCAPCTEADNPMLTVLRHPDQWASPEFNMLVSSNLIPGNGLENYFRDALAYPWRDLLVSWPKNASGATTLTLSQGIHQACENQEGPCHDYHLAVGSLGKTCTDWQNRIPATITNGSLTSEAGSNPFGFVVPLVAELPPASAFASEEAVQYWYGTQRSITVSASLPAVTVESTTAASTCGRITAYVPTRAFTKAWRDSDALTDYESAEYPGYIKTVLTIQLADASVSGAE